MNEALQRTQGLMVFLASASHGLEELLGRGAPSITFRAGRAKGREVEVRRQEPDNLMGALEAVAEEMERIGMRWPFEVYKKQADADPFAHDGGETQVKLVFRNCLIRSSLFRYGHEQKLSLCMMNHGVFCGLLEQIHGGRANLEIIHAGENACLKLLTVKK
jgi:predicted hydrocarbon binding protein